MTDPGNKVAVDFVEVQKKELVIGTNSMLLVLPDNNLSEASEDMIQSETRVPTKIPVQTYITPNPSPSVAQSKFERAYKPLSHCDL